MSRPKPLVPDHNLTKLLPLRFTPADHERVLSAARDCGYRYPTEYLRSVVISVLDARDATKRRGKNK